MAQVRKRRSNLTLISASPAAESADTTAPTRAPPSREAMIADAAYFRALQRHFEPGHELEDWLAAEQEVDKLSPSA